MNITEKIDNYLNEKQTDDIQLVGTKKHNISKEEAIKDAKELVKKWKKPYYVYMNKAAGTWDYSSEKPKKDKSITTSE